MMRLRHCIDICFVLMISVDFCRIYKFIQSTVCATILTKYQKATNITNINEFISAVETSLFSREKTYHLDKLIQKAAVMILLRQAKKKNQTPGAIDITDISINFLVQQSQFNRIITLRHMRRKKKQIIMTNDKLKLIIHYCISQCK